MHRLRSSILDQHTHFTDEKTETWRREWQALLGSNVVLEPGSLPVLRGRQLLTSTLITCYVSSPCSPDPPCISSVAAWTLQKWGPYGRGSGCWQNHGELNLPSQKAGSCPPSQGTRRASEVKEKLGQEELPSQPGPVALPLQRELAGCVSHDVSTTESTRGVQPPEPGCNDLIRHFQLL